MMNGSVSQYRTSTLSDRVVVVFPLIIYSSAVLFLQHAKNSVALGFCICCSLHLECSSACPYGRLFLLQVFAQMSPS